jgi:hypothetical protein
LYTFTLNTELPHEVGSELNVTNYATEYENRAGGRHFNPLQPRKWHLSGGSRRKNYKKTDKTRHLSCAKIIMSQTLLVTEKVIKCSSLCITK